MSAAAQPVARGGQPEDIANAVAYLAGEDSSFMTGTHLLVDGGLTIGQRHAWDPEAPGLFDALTQTEDAANAGAGAGARPPPRRGRRRGSRCPTASAGVALWSQTNSGRAARRVRVRQEG